MVHFRSTEAHLRTITVLLADDHAILREGLRALIALEEDLKVVGEASTGDEAIRLSSELRPDVVVLDLAMPGMNGLHAIPRFLNQNPEIRVLVLSMSGSEEVVMQAIEAGAAGYLVKETASRDLISAIRHVHRGNAFFSPEVSRVIIDLPKRRREGTSLDELTLRQREILQMIVDGKTSREIADCLCVSKKTVEKYRQQIMDKLGIHNTAGLIRYAITKRIVE